MPSAPTGRDYRAVGGGDTTLAHGEPMNAALRDVGRLWPIPLIWSLLWIALTLAAVAVVGAVRPQEIEPGEGFLALAPWVGLAGLCCGAAFGMLARIVAGRDVSDLSCLRATASGALVGVALPVVLGLGLPEIAVAAPLGALSALASLAILRIRDGARRKPQPAVT